jgi:hypothetical protein
MLARRVAGDSLEDLRHVALIGEAGFGGDLHERFG